MRNLQLIMIGACLISIAIPSLAQSEPELNALRDELRQLRTDYETRIAELERRLEIAEQKTAKQQVATTQDTVQGDTAPQTVQTDQSQVAAASTQNNRTGSGLFNPDIGVIFTGRAWSYDNNPDDYEIPGFPLGGETELAPDGLSLGETEINISANVDDKFTAWLTVPIHIHDGNTEIDVEEAWIETLKLPAGLSLRMGRFFSNIGYLNEKHPHAWDFADQPLPYKAFLGNHYLDDGLQMRWLAPTDFYLELGAEVSRGEHYPAGDESHSGHGAYTLRAKTGGDVGSGHSWQAGISYLQADAEERSISHAHGDDDHDDGHGHEDDEHDEEPDHEDGPLMFTGESDILMADFVWKWAPNGNWKQRNFIFQAEYIWRNEDGVYTLSDGDALPYDNDQQGFYLQAVYQPFPMWRFGVRYDQLSSDYPGVEFEDTPLMPAHNDPRRYSIMADFSNSEFSRFRLQYTLDQAGEEDDNQWGLQYIFSIGAHGAHSF